jgi:hypothetical protein
MFRTVLMILSVLGLCASPAALAAVETTSNLTFQSKGTIVDSFATVLGNVTGSPSSPAFTIYGGSDITPGRTLVGGVSTEDYYLDAYFFLGVTEAVPGAADAARHLVLGANQSLAGQSFESLFPTYSESALIDAIVGLNAGTVPSFGQEYAMVSGFETQFAPQYAFSLSGTGYLTAFSPGQDFGTITTTQTVVDVPSGVPEPVTWAMMAIGVGMIGAMRRRSRATQPGLA